MREKRVSRVKSEELYRLLFNKSADAILLTQPDGKISAANPAACRMFGRSEEEIIKLGRAGVIDSKDSRIPAAIEERRRTGQFKGEFNCVKKDGVAFPCDVTSTIFKDSGGNERTVMIIRDLTERKRAEEKLKNSEAEYRGLFEDSLLAISQAAPDGRMIRANKTYARMYGYKSQDQMIAEAKTIHQRYAHPEDREYVLRILDETGIMEPREFQLIRRDGTRFTALVSARAVKDPNGKLLYYQATHVDIAEQKRIEEELRETASLLRTVLSNAPITIFATDRQGKFTLSEGKGLEHAGLKPGENVGVSAVDLYDALPLIERTGAVITGRDVIRRVFAGETMIVRNKLHGVFFDNRIGPIYDADGNVAGMVGVAIDITDRIRAESEREAALEALSESEEIFRQFMKNSPIYVFFKDENTRAIRLSDNYEKMLGRPIDELLGKNVDELFPFELAKSMGADDMRILAENKQIVIEEELNGRFYTTFKFPINIEGKSRYLAGFTMDITERKRAEEALHESEARYRELFNRMSSGVAVYEAVDNGGDFIFRDFNPAAEKIEKVSRKDILGKRVSEVFPGVKAFGIFKVFQRVWQTGKSEHFPETIYEDERDPGSWRENWVFKLPAGEITAIYNDITERKRAEETLRKSESNLRALVMELSRVEASERQRLALFLHDEIGQSLALVQLKLGSLAGDSKSKFDKRQIKELRDWLETIIEQMHSLTFELSPPILHQLGLTAAIDWAGEKVSRDHGLHFTFNDDGEAKSLNSDLQAILFRCIRELMLNTVKHAKAKNLTVAIAREGEEILFVIADDGRGFDPSLQDTRTEEAGFGLLSVREYLAIIGGACRIQSAPGQGTRITLSVPVGGAEERDAACRIADGSLIQKNKPR